MESKVLRSERDLLELTEREKAAIVYLAPVQFYKEDGKEKVECLLKGKWELTLMEMVINANSGDSFILSTLKRVEIEKISLVRIFKAYSKEGYVVSSEVQDELLNSENIFKLFKSMDRIIGKGKL